MAAQPMCLVAGSRATLAAVLANSASGPTAGTALATKTPGAGTVGPKNIQAIDKVVPFFKKSLDLVASKLSLEVVPFWKTQANSGDHSATMFLGVFFPCV